MRAIGGVAPAVSGAVGAALAAVLGLACGLRTTSDPPPAAVGPGPDPPEVRASAEELARDIEAYLAAADLSAPTNFVYERLFNGAVFDPRGQWVGGRPVLAPPASPVRDPRSGPVDYLSPDERLRDLRFHHGRDCGQPMRDREMIERLERGR